MQIIYALFIVYLFYKAVQPNAPTTFIVTLGWISFVLNVIGIIFAILWLINLSKWEKESKIILSEKIILTISVALWLIIPPISFILTIIAMVKTRESLLIPEVDISISEPVAKTESIEKVLEELEIIKDKMDHNEKNNKSETPED